MHDPANPDSLTNNDIISIYIDKEGTIWYGTRGSGINQRIQKHFHNDHPTFNDLNSKIESLVWSVYEDHTGILWVGTAKGLFAYNPQTRISVHYLNDPNDPQSLSNNIVHAIIGDQDDNLWIGTAGGLNKFDQTTQTFDRYQHDPADPYSLSINGVYALYVDRSGVLWVGTNGGGLNKFNRETEQFTSYINDPGDPDSLDDNIIRSIYEDQADILWVGTGGGLNQLNRDTGQFIHYQNNPRDPESINDGTVYTIFEDSSGMFWVGTSIGGLNKFDSQTGKFHRYTEEDGLANNTVWGILEVDPPHEGESGLLWLSTSRGLTQFNPNLETFQNFDYSDGLHVNQYTFAHTNTNSGEMIFGGSIGLDVFNPANIQKNLLIPPVVLTNLLLENKPVEIRSDSPLTKSISDTDQLTLSFQEKILSLEFSALSFRNPQKNQYRYKLEGFEEDWIEVRSDRRFATYTNLDPGEYTFRVLGSNNDGVWNDEGVSLKITITPPWWGTNWFQISMVILILSLVAGIFVWQRQIARRRQSHLEEMVAERTIELQDIQIQLQTLFDSAPVGIGVTTLEGNILSVNQAMLKMTGYSEFDFLHLNVIDLYNDHSQRELLIEKLRSSRYVRDFGTEFKRADGSIFLASVSASIFSREGQDVLVAVIQDVTDLVNAQRTLGEKQALEAEQAAVEAERDRIARELHDAVTQSIYTSSLIAEALPDVWETHPQEALASLEDLRRLNEGALAEMRTLLLELRPDAIADRPLDELLYQLTEAMSARTKLPITISVIGDCELEKQVHITSYRIAQEALNNISKHAQANRAWVTLHCSPDVSRLRIRDDGIGFSLSTVPPTHMGINIMHERAEAIGAQLSIISQPGQGTEVMVEWQSAQMEHNNE